LLEYTCTEKRCAVKIDPTVLTVPRPHGGAAVEPRKQSQQDLAGRTTEPVNTTGPSYYADEKGHGYESSDSDDTDMPTEEEKHSLRKVADRLPWSAFLVALVELCERFAYYGLTGPFQVRIPPSTPPGEKPLMETQLICD
jgi:hypothetical protein